MGAPIVKEFGAENTCLKFFQYQGAACVVPQYGVEADANGKKIVKAGTPFPSNDGNCLGYLLTDVDVTQGDAAGTYVFEGTIDPAKLSANSIVVTSAAKAATPKVTFYETAYSPTSGS